MHNLELRRRVRALECTVAVMLLAGLGVAALSCRLAQPSAPDEEATVLRARGLVIEDDQGRPRLILGAPVPDPPGLAEPRAAPLHGLIIVDAQGRERGGYGTIDESDEVTFGIDDNTGTEVFKVSGNPRDGATMWIFHRNGAFVAATTYRGAPELHLRNEDGSSVQLPESTPPLR